MAKRIYTGVNDVARKITHAYVGVNGIARKIKKGYIGVNGVARTFYTVYEPFSSCPFPTNWVLTTNYNEATGTNNYGTWNILGENKSTSAYSIIKAFDNDADTYYKAGVGSAGAETPVNITIELPQEILINPKIINIKHRYTVMEESITHPGYIQGFNPKINDWENICKLKISSTTIREEIFDVDDEIYYSKFRVHVYPRSSSYNFELYSFEITSGIIEY